MAPRSPWSGAEGALVLVQSHPAGTTVTGGTGPSRHPTGADELRARRALVEQLAGRLDTLAREMADAYLALAHSSRPRDGLTRSRAAEAATEQLLYLLRAAATGAAVEAAPSGELDALAGVALELACAGCALGEVLEVCNASFLVAWQAVEEELAGMPESVRSTLSPQVRAALVAAMTRSTVVVSEVFQAQPSSTEGDDSVLYCALDGPDGLVRATRRAEAARWPVHHVHTVVVVACDRVDLHTAPVTGALEQLLEALAGLRIEGRRLLTCQRDGSVVVAVADGSPDTGEQSERWRHVVAALRAPPGYRLVAGAGLSQDCFAGVSVSYGQARRALEVGGSRRGMRVVVSYADVLPELLLLDNPTLAQCVYRLCVEPLERTHMGGDELIAALEVYLDLGLNAAAAADVLGVHRHTLAARLQQVERLTGLHIDDGDQRILLELAVRARRHQAQTGI
jgi:hypothetical protein